MKQTQVTIYDIAKSLEISASTVSRALQNNPKVSKSTIKAVHEKAQNLGYSPNSLASGLRSKKSKILGLVVPRVTRHFFSSVISGVQEKASELGYNVMICQSNEIYEKEVQQVKALVSSRVDGLIVSVSQSTKDSGHFELFKSGNKPLVFFDRILESFQANTIVGDDFNGGYKATKHLIEQGYSRIAHFTGPEHINVFRNKKAGYIKALQEHGIDIDESLILEHELTEKSALVAIKKLMNIKKKPDALFCANDTSAISVLQFAKGNGIKIPDDLAVVGYSNEPCVSLIEPALTTVEQSGVEIGRIAADILVKQIENKENYKKYESIVMPVELIVRKSSVKKFEIV